MELIDRYLFEVRRHLSYKNRADILKELRSALTDELESQYGPDPSREQVAAVLKQFGSPVEVAARYHPEGQYLIGPALYPLFKMIAGGVISAVIGAQVIAWLVTSFFSEKPANALATASSIFNGALIALAWLVIVFMILQHYQVRPSEKAKPWDPASLPPVMEKEEVKRTELVIAIVVNVVILSVLTWFQGKVGIYSSPGGAFIENPVIPQYIGWIYASILASIALDVYLLWQGRWTVASRWVQVGVNLLSIGVLALLVSTHQSWLRSHGVVGFQSGIDALTGSFGSDPQVFMMFAFWMGLGIGLIVTIVVTGVSIFEMARNMVMERA